MVRWEQVTSMSLETAEVQNGCRAGKTDSGSF